VIDPGLDRAGCAEVVDGEPEEDGVRALDLVAVSRRLIEVSPRMLESMCRR
jgi:hypothetical protein